jgi:ADP-ribosyl-[dinitrogen reductase] hydrolase
MEEEVNKDKAIGCLVGLAVGDAVGTTLEFTKPDPATGMLPRKLWLTDMVGGGPFKLMKGGHTDDTSMAIAMGESIAANGWDVTDQMHRYLGWRDHGWYSVKGRCFDIGGTTSGALSRFAQTGDPYAGSPGGGGNGALMRLAPVPIYAAYASPNEVADLAREESSLTHGHPDSETCCAAFALLCWAAMRGASKDEILTLHTRYPTLITGKAREVMETESYRRGPPHVTGSGYVLRSFEAALWAFDATDTFKDAVLLVTRLGRDTDTTGAITGQLAGAFYGFEGIPVDWREGIVWSDEIRHLGTAVLARGKVDEEARYEDERMLSEYRD